MTFEQGRNEFKIDAELLNNIVTENKNLPDEAKRDLIVCTDHPEIHPVQLGLLR